MIYICESCHRSLFSDARELDEAMRNGGAVKCRHCGMPNMLSQDKARSLDIGFERLCDADFAKASYYFGKAMQSAVGNRVKSPDAFLGNALSQFNVRTVYSDDDPKHLEMPKLVFYKYNSTYFCDNEDYITAKTICEEADDFQLQDELHKLKEYADRIDKVKEYYDEIASSKPANFKYSVFIAYEDDDPNELYQGLEVAKKINEDLRDLLPNIFIPDIDELFRNELKYEASVLYALEHSKCMLVITDNNISPSLLSMHSRYYIGKGKNDGTLGFVRYLGDGSVTLSDNSSANHIFNVDNVDSFCEFACLCNRQIYESKKVTGNTRKSDTITNKDKEIAVASVHKRPVIQRNSDGTVTFGSYPQKHAQRTEIKEKFADFGLPSSTDSNGWTVMFTDRTGKPYAWCRDEVIDGVKYRGVYYTQLRAVYSARTAKIEPCAQRNNFFPRGRIYCFEFMPLRWKVVSDGVVSTLATDEAIDSGEFNNTLSGDWEYASLRDWLNGSFYDTAFTDEEKEHMFQIGNDEDKVFLLNEGAELQNYCGKGRTITGSDYMRCVGGMCMNRAINNFWVLGKNQANDDEAHVVYPSGSSRVTTQYVDTTTVSIIPKIKLRLN